MRKTPQTKIFRNLIAAVTAILLLTCFLPMQSVFADTNIGLGRTFVGNTGDASGWIKTAKPNGNTFLTKYTVTYHPNGGVGRTTDETVDANTDYTIKDQEYTKKYFLFDGWNESPDGTGIRYENDQVIKVTRNITLYAYWSPKI
jgi:uncharacterized repeat protein (TIGR02543 family)